MIKAVEDYKIWSMQALNYNFNHVFICISIIYILSILFDLCLTFITFRLSIDSFLEGEISIIIREALCGEPVSCMLIIVLFGLPLIAVYGINVYLERREGRHVREMKICYVFILCICVLHIFGGFTNFFHIINL